MDRGRSISLIVIAIVILIDDQMPAGGSTLVSGRSTNCGCFRGCILHGTHRTYDQQHYGASFLPVSFTKSKSDTPGIPAGPSIPCSLSFLSFFFFFLPLFKRSRRADDDRPPPPRRPRSSYDERSSLALFFFFFFLYFTSPRPPSPFRHPDPLASVYSTAAQARTCTIGTCLNGKASWKSYTWFVDATTADPAENTLLGRVYNTRRIGQMISHR